jgi:predicted lipid-binding transport protein (Tim44 family)
LAIKNIRHVIPLFFGVSLFSVSQGTYASQITWGVQRLVYGLFGVLPAANMAGQSDGGELHAASLSSVLGALGLANAGPWMLGAVGVGTVFAIAAFVLIAYKALKPSKDLEFRRSSAGMINPLQFSQYKAKNVGNDASARPWERVIEEPSNSLEGGVEAPPGVGLGGAFTPHVAGFDAKAFVDAAEQIFLDLQKAWDCSDVGALHSMLSEQMLLDIDAQIQARLQAPSVPTIPTEVVTLSAQFLGVKEQGAHYLASVEFSGLLKDDPTQGPNPFRELWSMSRPKDLSRDWLVSSVQALQ